MLALLVPGVHMGAGGSPAPEPEPQPAAPPPQGRAEWLADYLPDQRSPEDVRRARQRFGVIPPDVQETITEVAVRQAERLEQDKQKQFDELRNELKLRSLEMRAGYLEALAAERERLIEEEIKRRMARLTEDEQVILLVMIAAGAVL